MTVARGVCGDEMVLGPWRKKWCTNWCRDGEGGGIEGGHADIRSHAGDGVQSSMMVLESDGRKWWRS